MSTPVANPRVSKLGFWAVFALVTGSQIGSGAFMFPSMLAPYGLYSTLGWVVSGLVATALAIIFAELCARHPSTGGPHVYVQDAFGPDCAFFVGWTYWVISWVSTSAVVVASISNLAPVIGTLAPGSNFLLQAALLGAVTVLNFRGVQAAGRVEFVLTLLKILPLLILPLLAFQGFEWGNFQVEASLQNGGITPLFGKVVLATLWGFIGLEAATTSAGAVRNPKRTIPLAIITGTASVALLYGLNSFGIMGMIPAQELAASPAPYVAVSQRLFGGNWHLGISIIACVVCLGTLNAWMLTSGQIALGLAQDGLLPQRFGRRNHHGAPYFGLTTSALGIVPLLWLSNKPNFVAQIDWIVNVSVMTFIFVYLICTLAFLKMLMAKRKEDRPRVNFKQALGMVVALFLVWIIYQTELEVTLVAGLFVASALPLYFFWYRSPMRHHGKKSTL